MAVFDLSKKHCYYFNAISAIPRGSRNEKAVSDFVVQFAKDRNLKWHQDSVFNVYIEKPATPGCESADQIILQAHLDMVCEKNRDSDHDFMNDPIHLYVDESGNLRARGTTLGCDDGFGVAYMLAILDSETISHPALQCWFTTMEEIGLLGAKEIKADEVHAKRMINLDGGGENVTAVSSAGGVNIILEKEMESAPDSNPAYCLTVEGLLGGHSGGMIHLERGNSILIAARALKYLSDCGLDIRIMSYSGGLKYNAIPREAQVVFTCDASFELIRGKTEQLLNQISSELEFSDPDVCLSVFQADPVSESFTGKCSMELIDFLYLLPNGFLHKSMAIEGLTLCSSNLGVLGTEGNTIRAEVLARSALESYCDLVASKMKTLGILCDVKTEVTERIPSWNYSANSELRNIFSGVLEQHGKTLTTIATHGGLETGIFKGLVPDMDIICMGPVSSGAHTPDEMMNLDSFDRTFEYLCEILSACK